MRHYIKRISLILALTLAVTSVSFPQPAVQAEGETRELPGRKLQLSGVLQFGDFPDNSALPGDVSFGEVMSEDACGDGNGEDELSCYDSPNDPPAADPASQPAVEALGDYLYAELKNRSEEIDMSAFSVTPADQGQILAGVINEHPDLYYVTDEISYTCDERADTVNTLSLNYASSGEYDDAAFQDAVKDALSNIKPGMTDLQKALVLHDYITVNCAYDYENYMNDTIPPVSRTAYGALVKHVAVCGGYALAYNYLLEKAGLNAMYVSGFADNGLGKGNRHAWNLVKIGAEYYHVDTTWDDPTPDLLGRSRHEYFLCSDSDISKRRHYGWSAPGGIKAKSAKYDDAFWKDLDVPIPVSGKNGYYIKSSDRTIRQKNLSEDIKTEGTILHTIDVWHVFGEQEDGYYNGAFSGLFLANKRLYFNTERAVYSIGTDDNDVWLEYEPDVSKGYVFGMAYRWGKYYYFVRNDPGGSKYSKIKELPKDVIQSGKKDVLASGEINEAYGKITWRIDKDRLLSVEGTGDFAPSSENRERAPWHKYADRILKAKVTVTGIKDASYMFADLNKMETLDLSSFDMSGLGNAKDMFAGCVSLSGIDVPAGLKLEIKLPANPGDLWYFPNYSETDVLPKGLAESAQLRKETATLAVTKDKTMYFCGENINYDDIRVVYHKRKDVSFEVTDYKIANIEHMGTEYPGLMYMEIAYKDMTATVEISVLPRLYAGGSGDCLKLFKDKRAYLPGEGFSLEDLKVFYCTEGEWIQKTSGFTTNADTLDMSKPGFKRLTVSCGDLTASMELAVLSGTDQYAVFFDGNGADSGYVGGLILEHGRETYIEAENTDFYTKTGYEFQEWNTMPDGSGKSAYYDFEFAGFGLYGSEDLEDIVKIAGQKGKISTTLYAIWRPMYYYIRYDKGESGVRGTAFRLNYKYDVTAKTSANRFSYQGYAFAGWQDKSGCVYPDKKEVANLMFYDDGASDEDDDESFEDLLFAKQDVVLTALWQPGFQISYVLGDGGVNHVDNPAVYTLDDGDVVLKDPIRPGYDFVAWYTDKACKKKLKNNTIAAANAKAVTVYAKWKAKKITINFDANAPAGMAPGKTMKAQTVTFGKSAKLKGNAYKISGYTFKGWNTKADGSGYFYANKAAADLRLLCRESSPTLYAVWEPAAQKEKTPKVAGQYKITYTGAVVGKNGVLLNENPGTFTAGGGSEITLSQPVRQGYKFAGWYADKKFKKPVSKIDTGKKKRC